MFLDFILVVGILLIFGLVVFVMVNLKQNKQRALPPDSLNGSEIDIDSLLGSDFDSDNGIESAIRELEELKNTEYKNDDPSYTSPPFVLNEIKPISIDDLNFNYEEPKSCLEDDNGAFFSNLKCEEFWKEGGRESIMMTLGNLYQQYKQGKGDIKKMLKMSELTNFNKKSKAERALQKAGINKSITEVTPDDIAKIKDPNKRKVLMQKLKRDGVVNKNLVIKSLSSAQVDQIIDDLHNKYDGLNDKMNKLYDTAELDKIKKSLQNIAYELNPKVHDRIPLNNNTPYKFKDPQPSDLIKQNRTIAMNKLLSDTFSGQMDNLDDLNYLKKLCNAKDPDMKKIAKFGLGDDIDKIKQKVTSTLAQMDAEGIEPKFNADELNDLEKTFKDAGIDFKGPSSVADINFDKPQIDGPNGKSMPNPNFVDTSKMDDAKLNSMLTDLKNKGLIDSRVTVVPDVDVDGKPKKAADTGNALRKVVILSISDGKVQYFDTGKALSQGDNAKALEKMDDILKKNPSDSISKIAQKYDNDPRKIINALHELKAKDFDLLQKKGVIPNDVTRVKNSKNGVMFNTFIKAVPDDVDPKMAKLGNAADAMDPKVAKSLVEAEKAFEEARKATRAGSVAKGAAGRAVFGGHLRRGVARSRLNIIGSF